MITELLGKGIESAIPGKDLAAALHCDIRDITAAVERERRQGQPICAVSGDKHGYFLAATLEELESYCGRLFHRAAELHKTRRALLKVLAAYKAQREKE